MTYNHRLDSDLDATEIDPNEPDLVAAVCAGETAYFVMTMAQGAHSNATKLAADGVEIAQRFLQGWESARQAHLDLQEERELQEENDSRVTSEIEAEQKELLIQGFNDYWD